MIEPISGTAAAVKAPAPGGGNATKAEEAPKAVAQIEIAPISPRLRFDAVSGVVVTEFLNGKNIASQTPSAAALAYLRAGLSPDGSPKPQENPAEA